MPRPNHKDTIVRSALEVFHEFGYHASGVQVIVDHAGVPKGSFYNHFQSKDDLGLEVLEAYWSQHEPVREALRDSDKSPLDRIDAHLAAFDVTQNGCLVGNFTGELANIPKFREALQDLFATWIGDLEFCIGQGQGDGTIRSDETAIALAEFVVTSLEGSVLKRKISMDERNFINFRKTMMLFLRPT